MDAIFVAAKDILENVFTIVLLYYINCGLTLRANNMYFSGYSYSPDYYKEGGYLCPSDIFYGRPKRAANTYGKWKVIVNLPDEYYAKGDYLKAS